MGRFTGKANDVITAKCFFFDHLPCKSLNNTTIKLYIHVASFTIEMNNAATKW